MLVEGDRLGQLIAQPVRTTVQNLEGLGIAVMPLHPHRQLFIKSLIGL